MKKIYVLSALTLLTVGLLTQPVKPVNEVKENVNFVEYAEDYANNQGINLDNKKTAVGVGEYDVSPTFVQYGMINEDGKDLYVMRFATAVKGDLTSLTYTRAAIENVSAEVNKEVKTLYSGISAGASTYYYDASTKEVSTDESLKGEYYWACYTVKYVNGANFNTDLSLSFKVNGEEVNKEVTSFNAEYSKVEDGSEAYPYLLSTNEELEDFIQQSANATLEGEHYKLTNNLNTNQQIGNTDYYFNGNFDGNGYSITSNINWSDDDDKTTPELRMGLFRVIGDKGIVRNLTIEGSYTLNNAQKEEANLEGNGVFTSANYGIIDNCVNNAEVTVNCVTKGVNYTVGGIAGVVHKTGIIKNSINKAKITCQGKRAAGIAGFMHTTTLENCKNYGEVNAYQGAAGIVSVLVKPDDNSYITKCENYAKITSSSTWAGGIVSYLTEPTSANRVYDCFISNCINEGDVTASQSAAGIAGYASNGTSAITNCVNRGNIHTTSTSLCHSGGIVGMLGSNNAVSNCTNYGNVTGTAISDQGIGGIIGSSYSTTTVTNCGSVLIDSATTDICKDTSINIGYIIGFYKSSTTKVTDCYLITE